MWYGPFALMWPLVTKIFGMNVWSALAVTYSEPSGAHAKPSGQRRSASATLVDDMAAADELARLAELSMQFWAALATGSGNLAYQLAFNTLREAVRHLPGLAAARADELRDVRGYRQIADAVRRRDGAAAARAARAHIAIGLAGILSLARNKS